MVKKIEKQKYICSKIISISECAICVIKTEDVSIYYLVYDQHNNTIGYVNSINDVNIEIYLTVPVSNLELNQEVYISDKILSIQFLESSLFMDPLGKSIVTKDKYNVSNEKPIELPIFQDSDGIKDRDALSEQLLTSVNAIDFIYPIGHGQRMLVVGDRKTYKTATLVKSIFTNYKNDQALSAKEREETIFIYATTNQRNANNAYIVDEVLSKVDNCIVVGASCTDPLTMQFLVPYSAMSIAKHYAMQGKKTCVLIDDLTHHANVYREMNLLLDHIPGRESYPSSIFYIHSSLLERSCKYNNGGSITCISVIECLGENIAGYICTNAISITDGQIFNSVSLMHQGLIIPVSTELSVSRTGSSVQLPVFKRCVSFCKKTIVLYNNIIKFYKMYRENCDKQTIDKVIAGSFMNAIMYNQFEIEMNIVNQAICSSVIIHADKILSKMNIKMVEANEHIDLIYEIIEDSHEALTKNKSLFKSVCKKEFTKENIAALDAVVLKNIK